jgi:hypothetical protein
MLDSGQEVTEISSLLVKKYSGASTIFINHIGTNFQLFKLYEKQNQFVYCIYFVIIKSIEYSFYTGLL